jgi:hypothetical protein
MARRTYIYTSIFSLPRKDLDMPHTEPDGSAMYLSTLNIYPPSVATGKESWGGMCVSFRS